jgi:hypothetical protein
MKRQQLFELCRWMSGFHRLLGASPSSLAALQRLKQRHPSHVPDAGDGRTQNKPKSSIKNKI